MEEKIKKYMEMLEALKTYGKEIMTEATEEEEEEFYDELDELDNLDYYLEASFNVLKAIERFK